MIKYVAIDSAENTAVMFDIYSGADWATFKDNYEADNPGLTLVNIGASLFPSGQNWYSGSGEFQRLPKPGAELFDYLQGNILANISSRTDDLEFAGTFTYAGSLFPRTNSVRDDAGLLAALTSASPGAAADLLPYKVVALDGGVVTLSTVSDCVAFATPMLQASKALASSNADQFEAVMAMTTITQLIQYVDPRQ